MLVHPKNQKIAQKSLKIKKTQNPQIIIENYKICLSQILTNVP